MRPLAIALSSLCLVLAIVLLVIGQSAQRKQAELTRQQEEINKGSMSQQVGVSLLREMAQVAAANARMRDLLQQNGYTLTVNTNQPTTKPVAR